MANKDHRHRYLNALLLVASLFGYLEWGEDQASFLWEIELSLFSNLSAIVHPFVFIPMIGQLFLIASILAKKPIKYITYTGITCISLLFLLMLYVGIISDRIWIVASTLPFLILSVVFFLYYRKLKYPKS
jgi:hypothetical protein